MCVTLEIKLLTASDWSPWLNSPPKKVTKFTTAKLV